MPHACAPGPRTAGRVQVWFPQGHGGHPGLRGPRGVPPHIPRPQPAGQGGPGAFHVRLQGGHLDGACTPAPAFRMRSLRKCTARTNDVCVCVHAHASSHTRHVHVHTRTKHTQLRSSPPQCNHDPKRWPTIIPCVLCQARPPRSHALLYIKPDPTNICTSPYCQPIFSEMPPSHSYAVPPVPLSRSSSALRGDVSPTHPHTPRSWAS